MIGAMLMSDSLDQARATVSEMIQNGNVPPELVGDIGLEALLELVSDLVQEAIKKNLTPALEEDRITEELITNMMESVANQAALIAISATIAELGADPSGEADFDMSIPPDDVADLVANLLRGKGVTIKLNVANERL
jgi:hypothetical protein